MLRRGFLKVLGAAIAVPWIGWPARRVARWSKWNLWIGGDAGKFDDPRCWSLGRVPSASDCVVVNTGHLRIPGDIDLEILALIGPGHIDVEANPASKIHPLIGTLTITREAADAGYTIGKQGRPL